MCKNLKCKYIAENKELECPVKLKEILSNMNSLEKTEMYVEIFHLKWGKYTLYTMVASLAFIFCATIVDTFFGTSIKQETGFDLKIFSSLQVWVGLILGVIATLFSIISMFLSFYNLQQQQESEKTVRELNGNLLFQLSNEMKVTLERELEKIHKQLLDQTDKIVKMEKEMINKKADSVTLSNDQAQERVENL